MASIKSYQTFVLVTAIISFIAFKPTLTWYVQWFWSNSGHFCQIFWNKFLELCGHNQFNAIVYGFILVTYTVFWSLIIIHLIVDLSGRPAFLLKYRIHEIEAKYSVSSSMIMGSFKYCLINHLIEIPVIIIGYLLLKWRGNPWEELPPLQRVILELCACYIITDFAFYYTHRLLHKPLLYKHIHKRHHEWQYPIIIAADHMHPIEHVLNGITGFIGPFLMGTHLAVMLIWFTIQIFMASVQHSGYHFPLLPSPEAHYYHHLNFNENYGFNAFGFWDRLHGTDSTFRKSKLYERHRILWSLVPIKELYPDEPKKIPLQNSGINSKTK